MPHKIKSLILMVLPLILFVSTPSKASYIVGYSGNTPKTASQGIMSIPNAYLYGLSGKRNLTLIYNSCDYIIQNYYDRLDECSRDTECSSLDVPFPSTSQPIFQVYDSYASNPAFGGGDNTPLKEYYGTCKFEPRSSYSSFGSNTVRTEKGWLKVGFNPTNSAWDSVNQKFLISPAQSVVTASEGAAMFNPSLGIARCGYDGFSNVTNGNYRNTAMIKAENGIVNKITWKESLDYIVAGQSLKGNLGIYSESSNFSVKDMLVKNLKGQLDKSTPMIVGECNSSCVDPTFEVYSIPSDTVDRSTSLTSGFSSTKDAWAIKKINSFNSPREAMPDSVLFTDETVLQQPGLNEYGQQIIATDKVLPGGSLFGYTSQYFFIR